MSAISVDDLCQAFERVAAGDCALEPLDGRRSWAALSIAAVVHAPDDSRRADALTALRRLRCAGFIEIVAACARGSAIENEARREGFESRSADSRTLFETIVEFGGAVVLDLGSEEKGSLRTAMWLAQRLGVTARRVAAMRVPDDAGALTDVILAAAAQ